MPSYTSFIQAALATLKEPNNSPTAPNDLFSGYGTQLCHCVETLNKKVSTRPVRQIAQGAERQAIIIEENTAEFTKSAETAESENNIEEKTVELTESAEIEAIKEGFKESTEPFDVTEAFDANIESRKNESKETFKYAETHYNILIKARGANLFPADLNIKIKLNDYDVNHEEFVEVYEMQQLTKENYEEDSMKENEDDVMQIVNEQIRVKDFTPAHVINLERPCKGKEGEVLDDATQIFNNQNRVEDSELAHVINLEDFQDMVECIEARLIVEAKEMQQLIRARALFTLDENYK